MDMVKYSSSGGSGVGDGVASGSGVDTGVVYSGSGNSPLGLAEQAVNSSAAARTKDIAVLLMGKII